MEWIKAKYHDVITYGEKATLFLFEEKEVWIPNKLFKFIEGKYIKLPLFIANNKNLKGVKIKPIIYQPKKLEPIYNQEPIEELRL